MKKILIKRVFQNDLRTYGVMGAKIEGRMEAFGVTLELPWLDNRPNVSRIRPGLYTARIYASPKRKGALVILLENVPGRKKVEVHIGNTTADTEGCLLAGEQFEWVETRSGRVRGILGSTKGMAELLTYLKGETDILVEIKDKF
jgi:hypothetical protein